MFLSPTVPNLPDYLGFLYGTVGIDPKLLPSTSGTATGGSTTTLIDAVQAWTANQWAGQALLDVTQNVIAPIKANDPITLTLLSALQAPVQAGDSYIVMQDIVVTSFQVAMEIVNDQIACASARMYTLAVYNLAADELINFADDQPDQSYFKDLRDDLGINDVTVGVVSGTSTETTSMMQLNPEQMKMFTLQNLRQLKTPYGRRYLEIAQSVGTIWGLS